MLWLVVFLTAVSVSLFVLGVAVAPSGQSRALKRRLSTLQQETVGYRDLEERRRRYAKRERIQELLETLGERMSGDSEARMGALRQQLTHAGFRSAKAPAIFLGIRLVLAVGATVAVFSFGSFAADEFTQLLLWVAFAGLLGWMLPYFYVKRRTKKRKRELQVALPDMLDLLVVCVEAGLGLNQALERVAEEMDRMSSTMNEELTLVSLEIRAGTPRTEALRNFARRTGLDDIRSFVGMLIQTDRFGTSIANALRVQSETLRTKRRQRAEEQAAKLSIKLLFPLVFFIFPAIFVVLLGPSVFALMDAFGSGPL